MSGRSYITVAGKAFRPGVMKLGPWRYFTLGLAVVYLVVVVVLPTLALIVAAFRKFLFIRNMESLFDTQAVFADPFRAAVRQSARHALDLEHDGGRAASPRSSAASFAFAIGYTVHRTQAAGRREHRRDLDPSGRDPRPRHRRRVSVGLDRAAGRALRHDLDSRARLHRALHARHHQGAVHLAAADPPRAGRSLLDLRQGTARHDPHHRAAARAPRRHRRR